MKLTATVASLWMVFAMSTVARADAGDRDRSDALDPDTAFTLSAVGAGLPAAVMGVSAIIAATGTRSDQDNGLGVLLVSQLVGLVTPSLGELYSRQIVTGGMAMRVGGLAIETLGMIHYFNNDIGDCAGAGSGQCVHAGGTYALIFGGVALYAGGMLYDVVRARDAARSWNRRHDVMVMPTAMRTGATTTPGVALALRF